ncbi:MAG: hypothetical protein JO112_07030 [Planctomycetes bacterium]|nr:hypothetical protein [Planctomycetota bacterium]
MAKPEWHRYDKSSKWLIQHHGDSILRLGNVRDIVSWRPLSSEIVQPQQLPDGLLEVQVAGQSEPILFILELATYPEPRLAEQILRDLAVVYLDRRTLPEVLAVIFHPQGHFQAPDRLDQESRLGLTRWQVNWRLVELWNLPAEELLNMPDVGLVPWVPLTHFTEPPEEVFRQCREKIDQQAPAQEHESLLAVTSVLASLRYNDPQLLTILGGKPAVLEYPIVQEIVAEKLQRMVLDILEVRFGSIPQEVVEELRAIVDEEKLHHLNKLAASSPDLNSWRTKWSVSQIMSRLAGRPRSRILGSQQDFFVGLDFG